MLERLFLEGHGNTKVRRTWSLVLDWTENVLGRPVPGPTLFPPPPPPPPLSLSLSPNGRRVDPAFMAKCKMDDCFVWLQSYLWNDNKAVVEWLEKELSETDSVIDENVKWIRRDWVLRQVKTYLNLLLEYDIETFITQGERSLEGLAVVSFGS